MPTYHVSPCKNTNLSRNEIVVAQVPSLAARILSISRPGQILCTKGVLNLRNVLRLQTIGLMEYSEFGTFGFKGISEGQNIVQLVPKGLHGRVYKDHFPSPKAKKIS